MSELHRKHGVLSCSCWRCQRGVRAAVQWGHGQGADGGGLNNAALREAGSSPGACRGPGGEIRGETQINGVCSGVKQEHLLPVPRTMTPS